MSRRTELTSFAVRVGLETRAAEWMDLLVRRRDACIATLDREKLHVEAVFRSTCEGRVWLTWLAIGSPDGAAVTSSTHDIDRLHVAFWNECVDRDVPPRRFETIVTFLPAAIDAAFAARDATLDGRRP